MTEISIEQTTCNKYYNIEDGINTTCNKCCKLYSGCCDSCIYNFYKYFREEFSCGTDIDTD